MSVNNYKNYNHTEKKNNMTKLFIYYKNNKSIRNIETQKESDWSINRLNMFLNFIVFISIDGYMNSDS